MNTLIQSKTVNGIDTAHLREAIAEISEDANKGQTQWHAATRWTGGTRSDTHISQVFIGGKRIAKNFHIQVDEPVELGGTNQAPNPQETLLAALNSCMIVGYAAGCALEGIELEELRIEAEGDIDLRGFLQIDPSVSPGYDQIRYTVHVKGSGTPEQFEKVHQTVMATSPNYFNLSNAVQLKARLVVE